METLRFLLTTSFFPPHFVGGDAVHVRDLADALARQGHEVNVLFSEDAAVRKGVYQVSNEMGGPVHVNSVRSGYPNFSVLITHLTNLNPGARAALEDSVKVFRPDVIHHHNIAALGWHPVSGPWTTVYTAHDYWSICPRSDLLKFGRRPCVHPNCLACNLATGIPPQFWRAHGGAIGAKFNPDLILCPSRYLLEQLKSRLRGFAGKLVHCPNFSPEVEYHQGERTDALLYAGVLSRYKGVRDLVTTAASDERIRLWLVGDGPERRALTEIVRRHNAEDRIEFRGKLDRRTLLGMYGDARAVVVPSGGPENAPLVVLEALSTGTPVVASRVGGIPEILDQISPRLCMDRQRLMTSLGEIGWVDQFRKQSRLAWERNYSPEAFLGRYLKAVSGES